MNKVEFKAELNKLNKEQKLAVDSIDGPVMVVAGPGTGKTQVLALRIANILDKTDTPANGILCLTFTRSGVSAMKNRLEKYIGSVSRDVTINTFHGFSSSIIDKYYEVLGFESAPNLIDDNQAVFIFDEILNQGEWEYIRTRSNKSQYFNDIKSLISLLKRLGVSPNDFTTLINLEISLLENDPESISSRGETKGQIKLAVQSKINQYNRTKEVVKFYELYESYKKQNLLMDYDDVLEYALEIVTLSSNARDDIREEYLYILVDEHQDSSLIQNSFLKAVWQDTDLPNIFVVGDDRQLIYGFSGANISYFEEFKHLFGKAKLITLVENYRSTENILSVADNLLSSSITKDKLKTNTKNNHKLNLQEYRYMRDEIIGTALDIKNKIDSGQNIDDIAVLVPKNKNINDIVTIFNSFGINTNTEKNLSLFSLPQTTSYLRMLKILVDPTNSILISEALLDTNISRVPVIEAHTFVKNFKKINEISISNLINNKETNNLFSSENKIVQFGKKIENYINELSRESISKIVSDIGNDIFIDVSKNHEELLLAVEIVRTFITLANEFMLKNPKGNLSDFLTYIERLEEYSTHINVLVLGRYNGVNIMTLHKSKGLEYKHVYIMHMNEEVISSSKINPFTLPEKIKDLVEKKSIETLKRELFVAITRAKEFCTITYSKYKNDNQEMSLAHIVQDIDGEYFVKNSSEENEQKILNSDVKNYAKRELCDISNNSLEDVINLVKERYTETKISVSMLNNFFECPWKWYFRNFLRLPEVKSISLSLGSAVHSTLEFLIKSTSLPDDKIIKEYLESQLINEGMVDEKEIERYSKSGMEAISNWVNNYYKILSKNRIAERSVTFNDKLFPNLTMYGKIDLTEIFGDTEIVVTDFKTGKSKTKNEIEKIDEYGRLSSYMRQLAMYSYLIKGNSYENFVTASRLLFLESDKNDKNSFYSTRITEEQIDLLKKDIKDYDTSLNTGDWVNLPCNQKSYGRDVPCEYCQKANTVIYLTS